MIIILGWIFLISIIPKNVKTVTPTRASLTQIDSNLQETNIMYIFISVSIIYIAINVITIGVLQFHPKINKKLKAKYRVLIESSTLIFTSIIYYGSVFRYIENLLSRRYISITIYTIFTIVYYGLLFSVVYFTEIHKSPNLQRLSKSNTSMFQAVLLVTLSIGYDLPYFLINTDKLLQQTPLIKAPIDKFNNMYNIIKEEVNFIEESIVHARSLIYFIIDLIKNNWLLKNFNINPKPIYDFIDILNKMNNIILEYENIIHIIDISMYQYIPIVLIITNVLKKTVYFIIYIVLISSVTSQISNIVPNNYIIATKMSLHIVLFVMVHIGGYFIIFTESIKNIIVYLTYNGISYLLYVIVYEKRNDKKFLGYVFKKIKPFYLITIMVTIDIIISLITNVADFGGTEYVMNTRANFIILLKTYAILQTFK
ncbi:hypothetical protein A3Q56_04263 [Intoshia linei]|uniref:G-protein coupled receptors family 1 profile domain-containing protein n=1 Tax=Intoshia linei TaxID=1819745 RepID=A0A177B321_9BILA|nr:hypothetical protein A3Q56_04263 [Intoshia linei]